MEWAFSIKAHVYTKWVWTLKEKYQIIWITKCIFGTAYLVENEISFIESTINKAKTSWNGIVRPMNCTKM